MGDNRPPEQIMAHLQAQCRELERQLHMSIDAERKAQNQIQQLQLMSKSQTAILRTNLSHKIEDREKLLDEALEALDSAAASSSSSSSSKSGEGGEAGGSPGAQTTTTTSATKVVMKTAIIHPVGVIAHAPAVARQACDRVRACETLPRPNRVVASPGDA